MHWRDFACVLLIFVGLLMFLYGANYYVELVGWAGLGLFISGFVVYFVLKAYEFLSARELAALRKKVVTRNSRV